MQGFFFWPGLFLARLVERLLTVVETCRRQKRNVFSWLVDAVEARFAGKTAPFLLSGVRNFTEVPMEGDNTLDISVVMDESQKILPRIYRKDCSGWVPNGRYIVLREDGTRFLEISYRHGVLHGPYVDFWRNGKVSSEGQHDKGEQEGIWHFYNEDGTISAIIHFKDGKGIEDTQYIYDEDGILRDIFRIHEKKEGRDS